MHTVIGPIILDEWGFSPELVAVTSDHEEMWGKDGSNKVTYVDVVIVANLHSYLGTKHPHTKLDWTKMPAFEKLGLTPEETIKTIEAARDELKEVRALFAA